MLFSRIENGTQDDWRDFASIVMQMRQEFRRVDVREVADIQDVATKREHKTHRLTTAALVDVIQVPPCTTNAARFVLLDRVAASAIAEGRKVVES